jgi:pyrroline-5-carboxylate reductase
VRATAGRARRTLGPGLPRTAGGHQRHGRRPDRRTPHPGGAGRGARARDPLPAVARRAGLTAIHPPHGLARALFEPLGGVIAVDDERALDALSASTATIAAHLAYLDTISRWLADRDVPQTDATRYVAAVFGALSGTLLATGPNDFRTMADEYATAGGINEQFLTALRHAGTFDIVDRALDDVARRLEGE